MFTSTDQATETCGRCTQPAVIAAILGDARVCGDCVDRAIEAALLEQATGQELPA